MNPESDEFFEPPLEEIGETKEEDRRSSPELIVLPETEEFLKRSSELVNTNVFVSKEVLASRIPTYAFVTENASFIENIIENADKVNSDNALMIACSLIDGTTTERKLAISILKKHADKIEELINNAGVIKNGSQLNVLINRIADSEDPILKKRVADSLEKVILDGAVDVTPIAQLENLLEKDPNRLESFVRIFLERLGLPSEKFLKAWKMASCKTTCFNLNTIYQLESERPGAAKALHERFNISVFERYPADILKEQFDTMDEDLPYGVVIFPTNDHNGSFNHNSDSINSLHKDLNSKLLIRIVEVNGKFAIARHLINLDRKYGEKNKISFAIVGGHGSKNEIQLGKASLKSYLGIGTNQILRKRDFEGKGVKRIGSYFVPNPEIVLISCSTGKKGGVAEKISTTYGANVNSPSVDTSPKTINATVDSQNKVVLNVKFSEGETATYESEMAA